MNAQPNLQLGVRQRVSAPSSYEMADEMNFLFYFFASIFLTACFSLTQKEEVRKMESEK